MGKINKGVTHQDLRTLHEWALERGNQELADRVLVTMKRTGYKRAFAEAGYTNNDISEMIMESIIPGFCFYCLNETQIEPDGQGKCNECDHGHVESVMITMGVI